MYYLLTEDKEDEEDVVRLNKVFAQHLLLVGCLSKYNMCSTKCTPQHQRIQEVAEGWRRKFIADWI